MKRACIVLGGGDDSIYVSGFDMVICADSGYRRLSERGQATHLVGDMDSLDTSMIREARDLEVDIRLFPIDKDLSDGEAALIVAIEEGADEIVIEGTMGDRSDHLLSTFFLLQAVPTHVKASLHMGNDTIILLRPGPPVVMNDPPRVISILSATEEVKVSTWGLRFSLSGEILKKGSTRGIHNEAVSELPKVQVLEGMAFLILSRAD
jgi:thiamine pyrophosphokinase